MLLCLLVSNDQKLRVGRISVSSVTGTIRMHAIITDALFRMFPLFQWTYCRWEI